jgi:hypothetical protein
VAEPPTACTRKEKAAAQDTSRRGALVSTLAPTLPELEDARPSVPCLRSLALRCAS